jgi:GDPmannose 4,6-dehydratase
MKKALILGVTGQDGSYLADILLKKGYEVHGLIRKSATGNTKNILHLIEDESVFNISFFLHRGDLLDSTSLYRVFSDVNPDEVYNEADQDHVGWSYDMVGYSSDITAGAVARILEMIKQIDPNIKYFQPLTSNMFGISNVDKQNELTPFNPQSPYAIAKTFAYYTTRYYRETFGIHASTAIFYNHESPRRTPEYVTRKITQSVARIYLGKQKKLVLGDMSARIDWGYAKDYMKAAWLTLQHKEADDYVIGSGKAYSVRDFVDKAFSIVGLEADKYIETSQEFMRPTKTSTLIADTSKAEKILNFKPEIDFANLVRIMVEEDLNNQKN